MQQTHEPAGRLVRGRLALASLAIIATMLVTTAAKNMTATPAATTLALPTTTTTTTTTTTAPAPTTTSTGPAETTPTMFPAAVQPRATIPMAEAKARGLWGGPPTTTAPPGVLCWSTYGGPAPDWLGTAIRAAGWPDEQVTNVCHIAGCESGFHEWSVARAGQATEVDGLMQVMRRSLPWTRILAENGWSGDQLLDPVINLTVARIGWEQMGARWTTAQWSCATSKVLGGR